MYFCSPGSASLALGGQTRAAFPYNEQLDFLKQKEEEGNTLVIRPAEKLKIGHVSHSREKMWETYNIGRKAAEDRLEEIISFISA